MKIANKMQYRGEKIEDVTIVKICMCIMIHELNYVVCSIKESKDITNLSLDELQSSLKTEKTINNEIDAIGRNDSWEMCDLLTQNHWSKVSLQNKIERKWTNAISTFLHGYLEEKELLIIFLYVNDIIHIRNCTDMFDEFKKSMKEEFEMTNLGMMHYFLGIEDCNLVNFCIEYGLKLHKDHERKMINNILYK
ncbi:hypothetical protein CR513_34844, partial [Mucuna pruriens]